MPCKECPDVKGEMIDVMNGPVELNGVVTEVFVNKAREDVEGVVGRLVLVVACGNCVVTC